MTEYGFPVRINTRAELTNRLNNPFRISHVKEHFNLLYPEVVRMNSSKHMYHHVINKDHMWQQFNHEKIMSEK